MQNQPDLDLPDIETQERGDQDESDVGGDAVT